MPIENHVIYLSSETTPETAAETMEDRKTHEKNVGTGKWKFLWMD